MENYLTQFWSLIYSIIHLHLNFDLDFYFDLNLDFFLLQIAQLHTSIDLFCLVLLTLEFTVFFLQLTQYVSVILLWHTAQHFQDFHFFFHLVIFSWHIIHWNEFITLNMSWLRFKESKLLIVFNYTLFYVFSLWNHVLFILKDNFLFHLFSSLK